LWCRSCNIDTNEKICPVCGSTTAEDTPVEVQWCRYCSIPIITTSNQSDKNICPICGENTKYISADLRPVFPEERLLIEILLKKPPNVWKSSSVWACNNRYYVQTASTKAAIQMRSSANSKQLRTKIPVKPLPGTSICSCRLTIADWLF